MIDFSKILGSVASAAGSAFLGPVGALAGPLVGAIGNGIFNAASVERERAWSEKMYNKYNSPAALVRQYQDAGINPALMFGQSAIPAPTNSTAAQAPENPFGDVVGMLGALMQLDMLSEQKRGLKITNDANELELVLRRQFGAARADAEIRQIEQSINLALAQTGEANTRSALNSAQADFVKAQKGILDLEKVEKEWRKTFVEKYHMSPELAGELVRSLTTLASAGLLSIGQIANLIKGSKGTHTRSITEKQADGTTITDTFSGFPDM